MRDDRERLLDIQEAVGRIERYSSRGREAFLMIGMRNILIHQYFEVDQDIIWSVVEKDLPDLKTRIATALQNS